MATPKVKGKNIAVSVNGHVIGCDKTCSISFTTSTLDSTTKCSNDTVTGVMWAENNPNINSAQITGNGLVPLKNSAGTDPYSLQELANLQMNQGAVGVTWTSADGKIGYYATGWITSLKSDAGYDAELTYDYTIDINGKVSVTPLS
jgi:hypothetical protein